MVEFNGSAERVAGGSPQAACEAATRIPCPRRREGRRSFGEGGATGQSKDGWGTRKRLSGRRRLTQAARAASVRRVCPRSANGAGDLGFTARDARTGARRRRGKPNGKRRERGGRLTPAAREATAGCPPRRDERGAQASAKVSRTGARRRGTRGAAGSGSRSFGEGARQSGGEPDTRGHLGLLLFLPSPRSCPLS